MDSITTRFEVLNSFETSMRMLLKQRAVTDHQVFLNDMLVIIKYVSSIKEGVFLAHEIKTFFEFLLPKVETDWKEAVFTPLLDATERYTEKLTAHLSKQQELFEQVSLIISTLDMAEHSNVKATIKSTLIPITVEFRVIKILCQIHNILFKKDQEKLGEAIEEFLLEFKSLEDNSTQPLKQLRGLVEQIRVVAQMPTEPSLVKKLLECAIGVANNFIHSFCGD
jgi:hypothetical protein